jgi:hypothetical protein
MLKIVANHSGVVVLVAVLLVAGCTAFKYNLMGPQLAAFNMCVREGHPEDFCADWAKWETARDGSQAAWQHNLNQAAQSYNQFLY